MSTELKPCPFCGSKKIKIYDTYGDKFTKSFKRVECEECGAMVIDDKKGHSLINVIEAWNRRVNDDERRTH